MYLKRLGINISEEKDPQVQYNELIQDEEIKKLIPNSDAISKYIKIREKYFEEYQTTQIKNTYFWKCLRQASLFPINMEQMLLECIQEGISTNFINLKTNKVLILYNFNPKYFGYLDYLLLHELTHGFETCFKTMNCGLESLNSTKDEVNQYRPEKRKYERLNEVISDLISFEAKSILHQKGIFIFKEEAKPDEENDKTTNEFLRNIIRPFYVAFKKEIMDAKLFGKIQKLKLAVGPENFEIINDTYNHIEYLVINGLERDLEENINSNLTQEFEMAITSINKVYDMLGINQVHRGM